MASSALFLLPVPDVDPGRYRHDVIHLVATEDLSVLSLIDNDDPQAVCEAAREQLPNYHHQILVETAAQTDCETVSDPPVWAKRLRAEFAITEGREPSLAALPKTAERDLFFEGLGALLLKWDAVIGLGRAFEATVQGETSGVAFDYAMALALAPDSSGLAVRLEHAGAADRRVAIALKEAPAGLARSLAMAFELPRVPVVDCGDAALTSIELMALSAAFGALAALPYDPSGAGLELSSAARRITATVRPAKVV